MEEEGKLKEPGMGCKRKEGPARELQEELAKEDNQLGGLLVNLPVVGSLIGLLIKGVADGNQRSNVECGRKSEK